MTNCVERQLTEISLHGPFTYNCCLGCPCDRMVTEKHFAFIFQQSEMRKTKSYSLSSELFSLFANYILENNIFYTSLPTCQVSPI